MFAESGDKVSVTLPSDREIRFTRVFDWPRELVFEAWTKPEHIRHWYGCGGSTITVCEVDLRQGGAWRTVMRMSDGSEHPFKGVYLDIVPAALLVYTECYDIAAIGRPEWLNTVIFDDLNGKTRLTNTLLHASREARDGHLKSGMETGIVHMFDRLEELLGSNVVKQESLA